MKGNLMIFCSAWILIGLLVVFNVRIGEMGDRFEKYCVEQYDVNGGCPCEKMKIQGSRFVPNFNFNLSTLNLTPVYTGNQSPS